MMVIKKPWRRRAALTAATAMAAAASLWVLGRSDGGTGQALAQSGSGLLGEYYDEMNFTNLKVTRVDSKIAFNWKDGAPDPSMGVETFSVRWTGTVTPLHSETYTFYTTSFDGARLWVNGQLLIDDWTYDEGEESGSIALVAGRPYSIKLEYYDNGGAALMELRWSSPSTAYDIVPATALSPSSAPPIDPLPEPSKNGLMFRESFEDQNPSCWTVPNASCGNFKVRRSAASIAVNEQARSGTKALKLKFTYVDEEGGGILVPNAEHVFYRFYDRYAKRFDFARGMKIARLSGYDAAKQENQYDHILVSRFTPNSGSACGTNVMGEMLMARNGGTNYQFWPQAFVEDQWYAVEVELKLNRPGQADGHVRVYIDGVRKVDRTGLSNLRDADDNLPINSLLVGGWFSNSDTSTNCTYPDPSPAVRYIDDVIVSSRYIGPEPTNVRGAASSERTISFITPDPGTTQIEYGLTASYGQSTTLNTTPVTNHTQTITGLTPGRAYHYRVKSTWSSGYAYVSPDYTFVAN